MSILLECKHYLVLCQVYFDIELVSREYAAKNLLICTTVSGGFIDARTKGEYQ